MYNSETPTTYLVTSKHSIGHGGLCVSAMKGWMADEHDKQHATKTPNVTLQTVGTASGYLRAVAHQKINNWQL